MSDRVVVELEVPAARALAELVERAQAQQVRNGRARVAGLDDVAVVLRQRAALAELLAARGQSLEVRRHGVFLSVRDASAMTGVPVRTLRRWCSRPGRIPGAEQVGDRWLIPQDWIEERA